VAGRGWFFSLHGILISVNYSREWHVLLTSALSFPRDTAAEFNFPPSALPRSAFLLSSRLSQPGCKNVVVVARRGANRRVLHRDARRLILVPRNTPFLGASRFSTIRFESHLPRCNPVIMRQLSEIFNRRN